MTNWKPQSMFHRDRPSVEQVVFWATMFLFAVGFTAACV